MKVVLVCLYLHEVEYIRKESIIEAACKQKIFKKKLYRKRI